MQIKWLENHWRIRNNMKEFNVNFDKICLDTDNNSVKMNVKDLEDEQIILHFSKTDRVTLLHQMQNNIYNTRQEFKQYIKKAKEDDEAREKEIRLKINEAVSEDIKREMKKELDKIIQKKKQEENKR